MSEIFLSREEVISLTDYKRYGKQCAVLRQMGIPFITNPTGRPIIVRAVLEGRQEQTASPRRKWQSSKIKA
ncbi:DUF4224 domain-containing protein [Eikenella sp. Marseille-P7795]|uniref:DUF4224 domain-containing protein n=1 Tax=Eikenella sp. Marseille-P7795 TaxID=2866577 RepID=UPI001CE4A410|nr:DUF4224 domain-containing protein [Eikenella sp. Marseille-P7795]